MSRADDFLEKYKTLEEQLSEKFNYDEKSGSPVMRFITDKEGKPFREKLNMCREVRNFLSHHAEIDGEPLVEPSEGMIRFLDEVNDYVCRPPLAISYSTLFADILKAGSRNKAITLMKKMQKQGFSHVPVIDNGVLTGVFSIGTFFSYALRHGMEALKDDMLIEDFMELLPPDKHESERFVFLPRTATLFEAKNEFENRAGRSKRLAVIFITDNGSISGRILGMLTPWDVVNER